MHIPQLLRLAGVACAVFVGGPQVCAQPSVMWTASESTPVMSGPSDSYYPVLKLPRGTELEVYQQLESGWLAVRPPQGSYSLVSATAVESVDYRTARITRDGAASRIGSALVEETSAVHVRLQQGELVEVLDPTADPLTHLIRIAPPAGEFRWVKAEDVSSRPVSPPVAAADSPDQSPAPLDSSSDVAAVPAPEPQPAAEPAPQATAASAENPLTNNPKNGEWRVRADEPMQVSSSEVAGNIEVVRFDSAEPVTSPPPTAPAQSPQPQSGSLQPTAGTTVQPAGETAAQSASNQGATSQAVAPNGSFAAQLDMLEIQLSRRIAGPANLWVFDDLEKESSRLAGLATQPEQVTRLRGLSSRMARFTDIANRHRATTAPQLAGGVAAPSAGASPMLAGPAATATPQGYDAVGVLRPVVSRRAGAPPYALVDDKGEVITFVTPGPSVNLQAYLGQRVAVSGTRAYLPAYRRRNIQTARVQPVAETRTR